MRHEDEARRLAFLSEAGPGLGAVEGNVLYLVGKAAGYLAREKQREGNMKAATKLRTLEAQIEVETEVDRD